MCSGRCKEIGTRDAFGIVRARKIELEKLRAREYAYGRYLYKNWRRWGK